MKELAILLVVVPFALLVVFVQDMQTFKLPSPGGSTAALPSGVVVLPAAPTPLPIAGAPVPSSDRFAAVFAAAQSWLGVPYLFGGCSRSGVDCSCAVRAWYAAVGVNLSRTTVTQKAQLPAVPLSQIQPGDILFFDNTCTGCGPNPTHEAMAIGGGQMIQAGGANVNITSYTTGFYAAHLSSAARVP